MWTYFSFLLSIYLGVELLDHFLTLCVTFWRTARPFCKVSASFTVLPAWSFQVTYILTKSYYLFKFSHHKGYEVASHYVFWFSFPWCLINWFLTKVIKWLNDRLFKKLYWNNCLFIDIHTHTHTTLMSHLQKILTWNGTQT